MARAPQIPPTEALLDEHAAAEMLAVSPRTMQDWRWRGGGPEYVRLGRAIRYAPAALRAYVAAHTRRSTSDAGARESA